MYVFASRPDMYLALLLSSSPPPPPSPLPPLPPPPPPPFLHSTFVFPSPPVFPNARLRSPAAASKAVGPQVASEPSVVRGRICIYIHTHMHTHRCTYTYTHRCTYTCIWRGKKHMRQRRCCASFLYSSYFCMRRIKHACQHVFHPTDIHIGLTGHVCALAAPLYHHAG